MRKKLKWVAIGVMLLLLILGVLFIRSGGKPISYEFDYFPEEKLKGLMSSRMSESEIELSGSLEVTTRARWYWLSKRFFPGIFLVNAKINGRKVGLVVDTGANITVLDPQVAINANVALIDKKGRAFSKIWEKEQVVHTYIGQVQELELDGLVARNIPVTVWTLRPTVKLLGIPIYYDDGFLGINLLRYLAVRLELQRGIITIKREPFPLKEGKGILSASLRIVEDVSLGPRPIVEGFIGDFGPFPFLVDTGATGPALVGEKIWDAIGFGDGGAERVNLERIRLGEIELHDVPGIKEKREFLREFILLGNNIFQAQGFKRVTLDFLAGKLYAER